jgi:uncharacterized protein (DUF1015 family)
MAVVRPFRGLRPRKDLVDSVASPPYDVLDSDEAREIVRENPLSFLRVVKPEVDLDPSVGLYEDEVYQQGRLNLRSMMENGILIQDPEPMYYFYRQVMGDHIQTGLVACVSAEDYDRDVIKKHEFTRREKERDRIRHIEAQNAQSGPVFLTYSDSSELDRLQEDVCSGPPEYDFTAPDGVRHTLWLVGGEELIDEVRRIFEGIQFLYVADGHHRSASGSIVASRRREGNPGHTGLEEYNYFLAVLFPKSQMMILPYNRVVKDLNGLSYTQFLEKLEERFRVAETTSKEPEGGRAYRMYLEGRWYTLEPREGSWPEDDAVKSLDASILQENLLDPVLGIEDPRTSDRIRFVGGIRGTGELEKLVDTGGYAVAFSLYPTSIDQLIAVADSGNVMPPKSTWFEPKLRSGMVVHVL